MLDRSLRGKPVIAAAEALMAQKTDVLTQVKALVIVLDVASVSNEFPDHCIKYHATSKALIGKLRKEVGRSSSYKCLNKKIVVS